MGRWLRVGVLGLPLAYLLAQAVRCRSAVGNAERRLEEYRPRTAALSYGSMSYVDEGAGEAVLCSHGIFGGYDQAFEACRDQVRTNRVVAPSRFGYPGSDVAGDGTPKEQAAAYVELLDALGIDRAYVLGTSAGGTVAIRFALDYPERTSGLVLYCSAPPLPKRPDGYAERQGPPPSLVNDYAMFLLSPLFGPIMGMAPSTVRTMVPIGRRRVGVELDATTTNPDMARRFDDYPIEDLRVPTLILHAKDDRVVDYGDMERVVSRFPNATFVPFETGGHLMTGHREEIARALESFQRSR